MNRADRRRAGLYGKPDAVAAMRRAMKGVLTPREALKLLPASARPQQRDAPPA